MKNKQDLIIVGGGIMGLLTAYYASRQYRKIVILEKRTIGNKYAASSGFSRSIRNDYLDPYYACLASEAQALWENLEKQSKEKFIIKCGCLNISKNLVTPNQQQTYTQLSYKTLQSLGFANKYFDNQKILNKEFPQFNANIGCLDINAGFLYIPTIIDWLKLILQKLGVKIIENACVVNIEENQKKIFVTTNSGKKIIGNKLALTVGAWSLELLNKIKQTRFLKLPIIPIEQQLDYFSVPKKLRVNYESDQLPVFAYLDAGIYGHPLYKDTPGLKVAYFDPMGAKLIKSVFNPQKQSVIKTNIDFIKICFPKLRPIKLIESELNWYDMTPDNNFIIDKLPGCKNIYIAAGFCGTGFKFAPLVGKIMSELISRDTTVYDINRFSAKRFGSFANLSVFKSLPFYKNFIWPRNWKYLKTGVNALLGFSKLP